MYPVPLKCKPCVHIRREQLFVIFQKSIILCANVTSGLTESRKTNTDSVMMTAFCLTKDELFSRFKINNGKTFKQIF